jgi:hypothetical protein
MTSYSINSTQGSFRKMTLHYLPSIHPTHCAKLLLPVWIKSRADPMASPASHYFRISLHLLFAFQGFSGWCFLEECLSFSYLNSMKHTSLSVHFEPFLSIFSLSNLNQYGILNKKSYGESLKLNTVYRMLVYTEILKTVKSPQKRCLFCWQLYWLFGDQKAVFWRFPSQHNH